jgi:hypothetical protein
MREDITRKRYFAIREYPLKHEDFEVEDMFPHGDTRTGVGLRLGGKYAKGDIG